MSLSDTPNPLESVWIQRNSQNQYYEQVNISGSDLIIYHSSSGQLMADKISVWAAMYGLNGGGGGISSSYAKSSSWSDNSGTASYANVAGTFKAALDPNYVIDAFGNAELATLGMGIGAMTYLTDGTVTTIDLESTSITASFISASSIVTVDPFSAQMVATKEYVDNLIQPFGFDYYFRSGSSGTGSYYRMEKLNVPLSASTENITIASVSASQYFVAFISPPIGVTSINAGNIQVHYHIYRVGGNATNSVGPELYLRNTSSVEREISSGSINIITTTTTDDFTDLITLTSSIVTDVSDVLVAKFKCIDGTGNPDIHFTVDGNTAAGITVPIPSSQFVKIAGDTMTGGLTAPSFTGPLFGTASFATSASSLTTQMPWDYLFTMDGSIPANYHVTNRDYSWQSGSQDLSALIQTVDSSSAGTYGNVLAFQSFNKAGSGFVFNRTVTLTKATTLVGFGNPCTIFSATNSFSGPMIQFGDASHQISGIGTVDNIRIYGGFGGPTCEGIKFTYCSEPNVRRSEINSFPLYGIHFPTAPFPYNYWSAIRDTWFVNSSVSGTCIYYEAAPQYLYPFVGTQEVHITDCFFADNTSTSGSIFITNGALQVNISRNRFTRGDSQFVPPIQIDSGSCIVIQENIFDGYATVPCVLVNTQSAPTNMQVLVQGNVARQGEFRVVTGSNANGVTVTNNYGSSSIVYHRGDGSGLTGVISASYSFTASVANSSSFSTSASWSPVQPEQLQSSSVSFATSSLSSSWASSSISSSWAHTLSNGSNDGIGVTYYFDNSGNIATTGQITLIGNHVGAVDLTNVSGQLNVDTPIVASNFIGTASFSNSSSVAITSSFSTTASFATSASWSPVQPEQLQSSSVSFATSSLSASYSSSSLSSSYAKSSSFSTTSSFVVSTLGTTWVTQSLLHYDQFNGGTAMAFGDNQWSVTGYGPYWSAVSNDGMNWTTGSSNMANANWNSMCYGNGIFVVVGDTNGIVSVSTDGLNWTTVYLPNFGGLASVAYGNGVFVAVSQDGATAAYSYDAINWTQTSTPSAAWTSVTFGYGRFVAVSTGHSTVTMYSYDGITWNQSTCYSGDWGAVGYGNGMFVGMVGPDGSHVGTSIYSRDGITWFTSSCPTIYARSITCGNGVFVCGGGSSGGAGNAVIISSVDGINWKNASLNLVLAERIESIVFAKGIFLALCNTLGYYTSGVIEDVFVESNNVYFGGLTLNGNASSSNVLKVNGNVYASSVTASLLGTASFATSASSLTTQMPWDYLFTMDGNIPTNYYATNRDYSWKSSSQDLSALVQTVDSSSAGTYGNVFAFQSYNKVGSGLGFLFNRTVTFTKATTVTGFGNPITIFNATSSFSGPLLQFGDAAHQISGIGTVDNIRLYGGFGGPTCEGIKFTYCSEPNIRRCEINDFPLYGVHFPPQPFPYIYWAAVRDSWFVNSSTGTCIYEEAAPDYIYGFPGTHELHITDCFFADNNSVSCSILIASGSLQTNISRNRFTRSDSQFVPPIQINSGSCVVIQENIFDGYYTVPCVLVNTQSAPTNMQVLVQGNVSRQGEFVVVTGSNANGVTVTNNYGSSSIVYHRGDGRGLTGVISASYASNTLSSSYSINASSASISVSASSATSASYAFSSSYGLSASYAFSASYASSSLSSSYAATASLARTASFAVSASSSISSLSTLTSSYLSNAVVTADLSGISVNGPIFLAEPVNGYTTKIMTATDDGFTTISPDPSIGYMDISGSLVVGTDIAYAPKNPLEVVGNISCSVITASLFFGTASLSRTASALTPLVQPTIFFSGTSNSGASTTRSLAMGNTSGTSEKGLLIICGSNAAGASGPGGDVALVGGQGKPFGNNAQPGGNIYLIGGPPKILGTSSATTGANGSNIALTAGFGTGSNVSGGTVTISAGNDTLTPISGAVGGITGSGGDIVFNAGVVSLSSVVSGANTLFVQGAVLIPTGNVMIGSGRPVNPLEVQGNISCSVITASLFNGTASYLSGSGQVVAPSSPGDIANKAYVDQLNPQGIDYYFRSSSSDISGYEQMLRLTSPLSGSTSTITVNNVSASQYFVTFVSPALNLANISQGTINVHTHIYRTGGASSNAFSPEIYIRSSSGVEYLELAAPSPTLITTTTTDSYTIPIVITSSIALHLDDRLVCKLKCNSGTGTPNITLTVDDGTAAGVSIPVPSSAFVLRTGDTMTGALTAPNFIGTASLANTSSFPWARVAGTGILYNTASGVGLNVGIGSNANVAGFINPPGELLTVVGMDYSSFSIGAKNANGDAGFAFTQGNSLGDTPGNGFIVFGVAGTTDDQIYGLDTGRAQRNSGDVIFQTYFGSAFHNIFYVPNGTNTLGVSGSIVAGSGVTGSLKGTTSVATALVSYTAPSATYVSNSANYITCSFSNRYATFALTTPGIYNFTTSNPASAGNVSEMELYITNTAATATSSFTYPADWVFLGGKLNAITASKNMVVNLKSYGGSTVATIGVQF